MHVFIILQRGTHKYFENLFIMLAGISPGTEALFALIFSNFFPTWLGVKEGIDSGVNELIFISFLSIGLHSFEIHAKLSAMTSACILSVKFSIDSTLTGSNFSWS